MDTQYPFKFKLNVLKMLRANMVVIIKQAIIKPNSKKRPYT